MLQFTKIHVFYFFVVIVATDCLVSDMLTVTVSAGPERTTTGHGEEWNISK